MLIQLPSEAFSSILKQKILRPNFSHLCNIERLAAHSLNVRICISSHRFLLNLNEKLHKQRHETERREISFIFSAWLRPLPLLGFIATGHAIMNVAAANMQIAFSTEKY